MTNAEKVCGSCDCSDPTALPGIRQECSCGCHGRRKPGNRTGKTQHTPGPWGTRRLQIGQEIWAGNILVATAHNWDTMKKVAQFGDTEQLDANARLIAAAPDLLEVAKNVLEWMELALPKFDGPLDVGNATHQVAIRAAIAKATQGGQ